MIERTMNIAEPLERTLAIAVPAGLFEEDGQQGARISCEVEFRDVPSVAPDDPAQIDFLFKTYGAGLTYDVGQGTFPIVNQTYRFETFSSILDGVFLEITLPEGEWVMPPSGTLIFRIWVEYLE
jgi:hypothetical protein